MKKLSPLLAFALAAMTAAAQTNDGMFYYAYDHDTQTATLTYRDVNDNKGGTYVGDVVVPAKAPNGYDVTVIGGNAFINSNDMTSLTIPATIDSIGRQPFENCSAHLTKIIIEDGDTPLRCHVEDAWPRGCFPVFGRDVQVEEMYIGRNYHSFVSRGWVEAVYEGSWSLIRDSEYLKTVTMGDVFAEVPYAMFYGCTQLQTVNVSPNVKSVGKEAFWNCGALTDINLPDGVEVIDEEAFGHCKSLEPFDLPNALKLIGAKAFLDCDMFRNFTIPASVDSLGVSILDDCDSLKRIDIAYSPAPLKMSCSNQFNNSLRSAPIDTLWTDRYIDGAFSDNRTLKKLYIGSNVEALHDYLFSDCYSVDEVFSLNVVPPTCEGGSVFYSGIKQNGTLHVPAESIAAYMQAYVWKDFFNIQPIGNVESGLDIDEEGNYLIASADDWKAFAELIIIEPTANVKMTADIDLGDDQTMVGTVEHPYQGSFDGQGHTLTVNLSSYYTFDIGAVAPFACVKDATIKNLHVAGSLKQQYCAAGGVAGNIQGNLTVSQCWVSAYLYVQGFSNNQGTIGGIASYCDDPAVTDCEIVIEDCIFSGEFGTGIHSGSMMSHVNGGYGNHATIRNCLNIGTFPSASGSSGTFIRPIQGDSFEIDNCYYKNSFGYVQGTQATEEQLADGTIANALQADREKQVWVQDADMNQPMLMVFTGNPTPEPHGKVTQKQLFATRLADMHTARMSHQIMPVDDGIVVFGGHTTGFSMTRTAERYSFATDSWTQMDMLYYQDYSAGIVTADGKMLLAGGMSGGGGTGASSQCELYDPSTNTFTSTGNMVQARSMATATMTESGKIYVNGCWYNSSYGLECYDPETGSFSKVAEGLNAYHPNLLALRGERVAIADGSTMVVIEEGTTTSVESDLLTEYPIMKGWDEMQMIYYQVADYSYILLGRSNSQAVLLNVYDDAEEGIKITKVADLPMTLPDNESVSIGYHDQASRVFIDSTSKKLYVQTCVLNDGYSPIIVEYDYPSATNLEGGSIVVYAMEKPLEQRAENAAWTMLANGTLVSVGGGENNFAPHKGAYIYFLGDGSEDPDGISLTPALSRGEGAIYNIAGQRVSKMQKGINIINGKKVLNR